jgi:ApaG protein
MNGLDSLRQAPPRLDDRSRRALWNRIYQMEEELQRAIVEERFEDAARLRDETRAARQQDRFVYLKQALVKAEEAQRTEEVQALRHALANETPPPVDNLFPERRSRGQRGDANRKSAVTGGGAFSQTGREREKELPKPTPQLSAALKRLEAALSATQSYSTDSKDGSDVRVPSIFDGVSNGVRVRVETFYRSDDSKPETGEYLFGYHVRIVNETSKTIQLISRYWKIETKEGLVSEVRGPGVVGKQPVLEPGEEFTYTSACPLKVQAPPKTGEAIGFMQGSYQFVTGALGELAFEVKIGRFGYYLPDLEGIGL